MTQWLHTQLFCNRSRPKKKFKTVENRAGTILYQSRAYENSDRVMKLAATVVTLQMFLHVAHTPLITLPVMMRIFTTATTDHVK